MQESNSLTQENWTPVYYSGEWTLQEKVRKTWHREGTDLIDWWVKVSKRCQSGISSGKWCVSKETRQHYLRTERTDTNDPARVKKHPPTHIKWPLVLASRNHGTNGEKGGVTGGQEVWNKTVPYEMLRTVKRYSRESTSVFLYRPSVHNGVWRYRICTRRDASYGREKGRGLGNKWTIC